MGGLRQPKCATRLDGAQLGPNEAPARPAVQLGDRPCAGAFAPRPCAAVQRSLGRDGCSLALHIGSSHSGQKIQGAVR